MAQEQTFRTTDFYQREIDQSAPRRQGPSGTPAGVIGTARRGPAFVPVTVGNFDEFVSIFGTLDPQKFGPYAVNEFLKHRSALTYLRVLGAGANTTTTHIATTQLTGRVQNAGFKVHTDTSATNTGRQVGATVFLASQQQVSTSETFGMPMFTDNDSVPGAAVNLIKGVVFMASGARLIIQDPTVSMSSYASVPVIGSDDDGVVDSTTNKIRLIISSSLGNEFANSQGFAGLKILTASLDPSDSDYFGKVMNTNPDKFVEEQHYLYADYAVDSELFSTTALVLLSGSTSTSSTSGDATMAFRNVFGTFDTRYTTPKTSMFISQPFGSTEYDLFRFESLDDGEYANTLYKISITNLKASLDESNRFGTFSVQIRDFNDNDLNPMVLESFNNCSLDPTSENYVAKLIGDRHVTYNFDATDSDEKRIYVTGKYKNMSKLVRIVMSDDVENKNVPDTTLPFGFRGINALKTNDTLLNTAASSRRLTGLFDSYGSTVVGAIVPPVPFRYKVTKGEIPLTAGFAGDPGPTEAASSQFHWGVKFERNNVPLNSNISSEPNKCIAAFARFAGIEKMDALVTGSGADRFNNNKFTLARVALSNTSVDHLTSSVSAHMREAAYLRNAVVDPSQYTIGSTIGNRITLGTILATSTASTFNRFSPYAKFTNMMFGGFDGVNILDKNARKMNDKATSFDSGGGAESSYVSPGFLTNLNGTGKNNSTVASYMTAIDIMTDPMAINTNLLAIPGIRESFITDYAMTKNKEYGFSYYVMDIPSYSVDTERLYDDSTGRPSHEKTSQQLDGRTVDNNYAGAYFPDVYIEDTVNKRSVAVPSSVAALGAIAFNDRVAYPWFAPAGFNRASLDFVKNVKLRLRSSDRERLTDSRINSIAVFPKLGYVIFEQRTLQMNKSSLDRVNVRRMLLEVKRVVTDVAKQLVFEQNTQATRNKFVADSIIRLGLIQAQQGIEKFKVVMDESNNTQEDIDLNKMNGKVIVIPTKTAETIALDFIITAAGVEFV